MPLAEGFGDEVILLFFAFLVGIIMVLVWMSTHVDSRFLVPIIILDRDRFSALIHRLRGFTEQRFGEQQQQRASAPPSDSSPDAEVEVVESGEEESNVQRAQDPSSIGDQTCESDPEERPPASSPPDSTCGQSIDDIVSSSGQTDALLTDASSSSPASDPSQTTLIADPIHRSLDQRVPVTPVLNGNQGTFGFSERNDGNATNIPEGHIRIRLQYIDGRQRMVSAKPDETVGEFKRNNFSTELAGRSVIRFVMNGQELRDDPLTLRSCGVHDGSVIHCLITEARVEPVVTASDSFHFEIGFLMLPLFGFLLTLLWYARIAYRSYFSGASTCSLVAISFLYVIGLIGSFRSHRVNHPHQD